MKLPNEQLIINSTDRPSIKGRIEMKSGAHSTLRPLGVIPK